MPHRRGHRRCRAAGPRCAGPAIDPGECDRCSDPGSTAAPTASALTRSAATSTAPAATASCRADPRCCRSRTPSRPPAAADDVLDLDIEQIANRVGVFGAVEAADERPARIRVSGRRAIELGLQPRGQGVISGLVRSRHARRRHRPRAQFADDALPHVTVVGDAREVHPVERQVGGFRAVVVTRDTVLLDHGGVRRCGRSGPRTSLRPGAAWSSDQPIARVQTDVKSRRRRPDTY